MREGVERGMENARYITATEDKTASIDAENDTFVQNSIIGRSAAEFL